MYDDDAVGDPDDSGFSINDEFEVGDLADQQGGVLDPAQRVSFEVRKASIRTIEDKQNGNTWMLRKLAVEVSISPLGVDGEGKLANKRIFPEFILVMNTTDYPDKYGSDWWKREARYPTKQFLKALGIDISSVRVNDEFLAGLMGREFIADIKRKERREKVEGKYRGTGEFENQLDNFRAVSQ